jgi:hypothetical protein
VPADLLKEVLNSVIKPGRQDDAGDAADALAPGEAVGDARQPVLIRLVIVVEEGDDVAAPSPAWLSTTLRRASDVGALSTTTTSNRGYCCPARRLRHFFICSGRSRVQTTTLMNGAPASSAARSRRNGHASPSAVRPLPVRAVGAESPASWNRRATGALTSAHSSAASTSGAIPSRGSVVTQTPIGSVCNRTRIQARP